MIKQLYYQFFTAVMFFTRLPSPTHIPYHQDILNRCNKFLPIIGVIVGGIGALTFWISAQILPISIAIILSMIATVLTTGAFHEDGFADVCDAFGGGWKKEDILRIMKDSRVGAYGVIGILLLLMTKFLSLSELKNISIPLVIISGHAWSRALAVHSMYHLSYVREDETSKSKPIAHTLPIPSLIFALITGIVPILFLGNYFFLTALFPPIFAKYFLERYFVKWIGGYTGDCLGAIQQLTEVVFYISILAILHFIPIQ